MDRSNLTRSSGRFWSPDSGWNTEVAHLPVEAHDWGTARLRLACGREGAVVLHAGPDDTPISVHCGYPRHDAWSARVGTLRPTDAYVAVIDHDARLVASGDRWRASTASSASIDPDGGGIGEWTTEPCWECDDLVVESLDGEGWGSAAGGLVLEREIAGLSISHALALLCPDPEMYGRRFRLAESDEVGSIDGAIAEALWLYGGFCVGVDPDVVVLCERSGAASLDDEVGPVYRACGIGSDRWALGIDVSDLALVREPR